MKGIGVQVTSEWLRRGRRGLTLMSGHDAKNVQAVSKAARSTSVTIAYSLCQNSITDPLSLHPVAGFISIPTARPDASLPYMSKSSLMTCCERHAKFTMRYSCQQTQLSLYNVA